MRKLQFVVSIPLVLACGVQAQALAGKPLYTRLDTTRRADASASAKYDFRSIDALLVETTTVTNPTKHDPPRLDVTLDNGALATPELTVSAPAPAGRTGRLRGLWPRRRRTKSQFAPQKAKDIQRLEKLGIA
jgi:hypothetical protein